MLTQDLDHTALAELILLSQLSGLHADSERRCSRPQGTGGRQTTIRSGSVLAVTGITNKSLHALMTGLLGGTDYTMNQASFDLASLRTNGLITRMPGQNRYRLTGDGLRFAIFYARLHDRLLRPCSPQTGHQRHRRHETNCRPSTFTSPKPWTTPG